MKKSVVNILLFVSGGIVAYLIFRKKSTNTTVSGDVVYAPADVTTPPFYSTPVSQPSFTGVILSEDAMQFNTLKNVGYQNATTGKFRKPDLNKIQGAAVSKIGSVAFNDAVTAQRNYLDSLGARYDDDYVRTRAALIGAVLVPQQIANGTSRVIDMLQLPVASGGLSDDYFIFT